jgi:hypothetical protein
MPNLPMIHVAEWKKLEPLLPPAGGPGKPRSDDRLMLSAFYYAEACRCSLDSLPAGYGNKSSLQSRRRRWTVDGTLPRLMEAGAPVIARMHANYWDLIHDAPINWNNSREFFGRGVIPKLPHAQPRGRYAGRQRP